MIPEMIAAAPAPGRRVRVTEPEFAGTEVHHSLYLPANFTREAKMPLLVEYPGNEFIACGSFGTVGGARLGLALTGGVDFISVVLPLIALGRQGNEKKWWGDVEATVDYARLVVPRLVRDYGADPAAVILAGFSRGAMAVSYIGLHDDDIAGRWTGFFTHDHFDGARAWPGPWGSPLADYRRGAMERLARVGRRPIWISQNDGEAEPEMERIQEWLAAKPMPEAEITLTSIPSRTLLAEQKVEHHHNDIWPTLPIAEADRAGAWLYRVAGRVQRKQAHSL